MLRIEKINKKAGCFSLTDINLVVEKGDYFVLIGESGAGKSMLLELISGLMVPDSGNIYMDDSDLLQIPIQHRKTGIIYQKPTLFPHLNVFENIAYPLKSRKFRKRETREKVMQLAEAMEILPLLDRKVANLSGGEAQRVTLARTLATEPEILMLDEPLSFLDIQLRKGIISLLRKLNQAGQTILHVTHDYEEALALANKIAIIEKGRIIQTGSPLEVFFNPSSTFVADFIGIRNYFKGKLLDTVGKNGYRQFETRGVIIHLLTEYQAGTEGFVMIPPGSVTITEDTTTLEVNDFTAEIKDFYPTRNGTEIVCDIGIEMTVHPDEHLPENLKLKAGKKLRLSFPVDSVIFRAIR